MKAILVVNKISVRTWNLTFSIPFFSDSIFKCPVVAAMIASRVRFLIVSVKIFGTRAFQNLNLVVLAHSLSIRFV